MLVVNQDYLVRLTSKYVTGWKYNGISIRLSFDPDRLPIFTETVHECTVRERWSQAFPETNGILSPPFAMVHINHNDDNTTYDDYLSLIVDDHLDSRLELCWTGSDGDFEKKLFRLIHDLHVHKNDEIEADDDDEVETEEGPEQEVRV